MRSRLVIVGLSVLAGMTVCFGMTPVASAADWPQWRGLKRDGISAEQGLLAQWPAEGPKLVWQIDDAGDGYSTPAVVGDRIYLMGNKGMDDEFVEVRNAKDGKLVWSVRVGPVGPNKGPQYPGSRSTPTVDGTSIYALGSDGDLACLDAASGASKWHKNLRTDFAGQMGQWAYSESVLIDGDVLVCTPGGSEATILALDKKTGDVIWKSAIAEGDQAAYSSAILFEVGGAKQYVQFLQKGLVGVDAKTGKFLWRYDHTAKGSPANIPTPVAAGSYVYSAAGRSGGGLANVKATDGGFDAEEVYYSPKLPTSIGGAVLVDGKLYGTNTQGLLCADFLTGEVKWQDRSVGAGSTCSADGRLYVHGEKGDVALVEATADGYQEKGRFALPGQPDRGKSQAWAYPVVANGRLYIRDLAVLWCYDVQSSSAGK
jgi:outer membrane protein assembly factor BamB